MNRKFFTHLVLLFLLCSPELILSQTAQIGTGTETPGNTLYAPIYRYSSSSSNDYARSNILYTASEMATAGITSGAVINQVSFYKVGAGATNGAANFSMYMANSTTAPPLSTSTTWASIMSSHTQVYSNASQTISATSGWVDFALTTPFVYTGGSLEIAFDWDISSVSGSPATDGFDWQYTTGFEDQIIGAVSSSSSPSTLSATVSGYKHRPNIMIAYTPGSACTSPPTAGASTASPGTVCASDAVQLSLSGNSTGMGQTYQWESSSTMGGTYTPFGTPDITPATTVNPSATTWYRAAVTCGGNTTYSTPIEVVVNPAFPGGTYTINSAVSTGGGNYQTFADAMLAISCGISGPIIFDVAAGSGPYNEQVMIPALNGLNATNTLTINGNGTTLSFNSTNTNERAGIKLDGADYVTINDLTIEATGTSTTEYGFGVQLLNDADNNTINNCIINLNTTSTSSNYVGISVSNSATSATSTGTTGCDNNTFSNNTVTGGYYGITLVASATSPINNNKILNNTFTDFYSRAVYLSGNNNALVEGNNISKPTRGNTTTFYGIYATGDHMGLRISKNRIHNPFGGNNSTTSTMYGIYFTGVDGVVGQENVVSNNIIYDMDGEGSLYGLYNSSSDYIHYYHNTISLDNINSTSSSLTRAFYQTSTAAGIEFKNNIVTIGRTGTGTKTAIYLNTSASDVTSDYNVLFISATDGTRYIGYSGSGSASLAAWQGSSTMDGNSVSNNPIYDNPSSGNFQPTTYLVDNRGTPVGILTDINDSTRSTATPDMGAYEFEVPVCVSPPTPGTATSSVSNSICPGETVSLDLSGNSIGILQTYQWQSSSTQSGTYTDFGPAQNNPPTTINPTVTAWYRAAVTCSGSTMYSDPVQVLVSGIFPGGTYTINSTMPTGGSNFQTFADAWNAIRCGVGGTVIFNVDSLSGPYTNQLVFDSIAGTSDTSRIIFNGNGTTLSFNSSVSSERAGILLNGADYITIENFNIEATGTTTSEYGFGIQLTNGATNNVIKNNNIVVTSTLSSSNYAGIVISNSLTSATGTGDNNNSDNTIMNNSVAGGYYGITVVGNGTTAQVAGNKIMYNTVQDFYAYGIYLNGNTGATIEGNDISNPTRTVNTSFRGIYLTSGNNNVRVNKNRIHNPFGNELNATLAFYGIYLTSSDATMGNENLIVNNLIYDVNGAGSQYALYNSGSDYAKYYHNTVSLDDSSASCNCLARGFYQTGTATGIELKNNIITVRRGGTGAKYAVYLGSNGSSFNNDNNVYYVNGAAGSNNIGYFSGSSHNTLAAWQGATSHDGNSLAVKPKYEDPANDSLQPTSAIIDNIGVYVGVATDINGNPRSTTNPDPGAYRFDAALPVKLVSLSAQKMQNNVLVNWSTASEVNQAGFEIERSFDGSDFIIAGSVSAVGSASQLTRYSYTDRGIISQASLFNKDHVYYRLKMINRDGTFEYSQVVSLKLDDKETEITVYPNPVDEELFVRISAETKGKISIRLTDMTGRTLLTQNTEVLEGANLLQLDIPANIGKGIYLLIIDCNGKKEVQKISKN